MSKQDTIDRWSDYIIPAVFRAEDTLQRVKPEWVERLRKLREPGGEDPSEVAKEYCREIAEIIVNQK